jgi:ferredoxin
MATRAAWSGDALGLALGPTASADFDLAALSALLAPHRASADAAPRVARAQALRAALSGAKVLRLPPSAWVFQSCAAAARALGERLGDLEALMHTVAQAHLETPGRDNARPGQLETLAEGEGARALLPPSLVLLDADALTGEEQAQLLELLGTDLPIKVLCTSDRLVSTTMPSTLLGHSALPGGRAALLAAAARANAGVFVVQAAASELARCGPSLVQALAAPGPALIAVYTGAHDEVLPAYVAAAAACAARIFPTLVRAPGAPPSLALNPEPLAAWPCVTFAGEDPALQRVQVTEPFCAAHVLACWPALADEVEVQYQPAWQDDQRLVGEWTQNPDASVAYVHLVDARDRWVRGFVSGHLLAYTQHVAEAWRALQHAAELPAELHAPVEEAVSGVVAKPKPTPPVADAPPTATVADGPGQAYVETARCSSCDECVKRAPGLFAYNADKRAVLREPRTGSYREMVEAAEHCKMAIIHPGGPWDENEPELPELRERAALFG